MSVHTIHQSKKGITLVDGFYLVRNPRTQTKSVISITNDIVYVHDISRKMSLQDLINLDSIERIEVYGELKQVEDSKQKKKK